MAQASLSVPAKVTMTNAKYEVEKFDGHNNFGMWQCEVLDFLYQQELDVALEEEKPEKFNDKEWERINRQACGTIRSCLSREQKYPFMKETSASKMWNELENKFMKKNCENRLYLKKKLFRFQYQPGTSINDHIAAFNKLIADLLNLDETVEDEDQALLLLASLPEEYDHLVTTLLRGKDKVTFDEVYNSLYNTEIRKKDQKEHGYNTGEVYAVRGRSQSRKSNRKGRSQSRGRPSKDECAFCHEKGHWKKDCPKLKKKDKGKVDSDACVAKCEDDDSDFALIGLPSISYSDEWILDSGCTYHMCPHKEWFLNFEEFDGGVVFMGNDSSCKTVGIGSIRLKNYDGSTRLLTDVRCVPGLKKNLISLGALEAKGFIMSIRGGVLKVTSGALVVMKGTRKNNLYYLQCSTVIGSVATVSKKEAEADADAETTMLWHMRLGYAGVGALQNLVKQGLLKGVKICKLDFCEHYVMGKQTRVKFGTAIHNTKGILDYVHSDVWGPSRTASLGGMHYFVTFVDDYSRRVWVYVIKSKDEVLEVFLKWKKMIETQTGRKIKKLRTDNGGEYKYDPFLKICQDEGIVRHFTVRKTPQQNGVAERMNRTLLEKVRCMLLNAKLSKGFWAEAVTYACHLINRLPSAAIGDKTPFEVWFGKSANDYDSLHVFGSTAYYHVKESKLDPRAKKAVFMGISSGVKGYRLWCPNSKRIIFSRDVTFDESAMLKNVAFFENEKMINGVQQQVESAPQQVEFEKTTIEPVDVNSPVVEEDVEEEKAEVLTQEPPQQPRSIALDRPRRESKKPARFLDTVVAYALPVVDDVPSTYREAVRSSENKKWKRAMDEEMQSIQKILLHKIGTADNPADMMTKVVTSTKFKHCLNLVNILQV